MLPEDSAAAAIFRDMKTVLEGIRGLSLVRDAFEVQIPLNELIEDPEAVAAFLKNNTGLDDASISAIINSDFKANTVSC